MLSASMMSVAADLAAQNLRSVRSKEQKWSWDALSTMRFALWALVCTPIIDAWLTQLDRVFGGGSNMLVVAQKLLVDQVFFGPCFLTLFFTFVGFYDFVTQGKDLKFLNFKKLFMEQVLPTHRNGMMFWLPIHLANFTIVPLGLRVVVINLAGLIFNVMLALRLSVDHPSPPHRPADDLHAQLDSSHEARKELKESIEQEVSKGRLVPSFSGERLLRSIRSIESLPVPPYGGRLRRKQTFMSSDMAAKLPSTFSSPIGLRTGFRCL